MKADETNGLFDRTNEGVVKDDHDEQEALRIVQNELKSERHQNQENSNKIWEMENFLSRLEQENYKKSQQVDMKLKKLKDFFDHQSRENSKKLWEMQKLFWEMQLENSKKNKEIATLISTQVALEAQLQAGDHQTSACGNEAQTLLGSDWFSNENVYVDSEIPSSSAENTTNETVKTFLSEDVFSFLMTGKYEFGSNILPVLFAWVVFGFQIFALSLIFNNIFDSHATDGNVFGFPSNVDQSTRAAELTALIITAASEEDTRKSLLLWKHGYFTSNFETPSKTNVTLVNWTSSVCSRVILGLGNIFVTFLLIMRSEEVVDLLLNFTAVQFVGRLDDVAFFLAKEGFLGRRLQEETGEVQGSFYRRSYTSELQALASGNPSNQSLSGTTNGAYKASYVGQMILFLMVLAPLISGWAVVFHKQLNGQYSCNLVMLQFGDGVLQYLSTFSGPYSYERINQHMEYVSANGRARFQYCSGEEAWTFSFSSASASPSEALGDNCQDWVVRSSRSKSYQYDLIAAVSSEWIVRSEGKEVIMDYLRLFCLDCDDQQFCGTNGNCISNICECDEGWYGHRCDFWEPCLSLTVDEASRPFQGIRAWSNEYSRLESTNGGFVSVYGLPVYFSESKVPPGFDLILYTGRRWVLTASDFHNDFVGDTEDDLVWYLENDFNGYYSDYTISFISAPVDINTATASDTPIGVNWFQVEPGSSLHDIEFFISTETTLLCAICNNATNPCQSDGICLVDGHCDCSANGGSGVLCQVATAGNGYCDLAFNSVEFNFDGGDCCEATCVNGDFNCGQQKEFSVYRGYCHCLQNNCPDNGETCWIVNSRPVYSDETSGTLGSSVALSADGQIIAIGDPGMDVVKVFRQYGSEWVKQGDVIQGEAGSRFGESIAISGNGLILVVGSPLFETNRLDLNGVVDVFELPGNSKTWQSIDSTSTNEDIFGSTPTPIIIGSLLSLSQDGNVIYVGRLFSTRERTDFFRFEWNVGTKSYFLPNSLRVPQAFILLDENPSLSLWGEFVSVSNFGDVIALESESELYGKVVQVLKFENGGNGLPLNPNYKLLVSKIGCCGVISGDGHVLAVYLMESGASEIFFWNQSEGSWIKRGNQLEGMIKALSFDGSTVVMTRRDNAFFIQAYSWNGSNWILRENFTVSGTSKPSLFLSGGKDGGSAIMAVGLPSDDILGPAKSQTFTNHLMHHEEVDVCMNRLSAVRLELMTDNYPNETIWEVRDVFTKKTLWSEGPFEQNQNSSHNLFVFDNMYLPNDVLCVEFSIFDLGGDGICCGNGFGSFWLYYGGNLVANGGIFDWTETHHFGRCKYDCEEGSTHFSFSLTTDENPDETSWSLVDQNSGITLSQAGPYKESNATDNREFCIDSSICAMFTIFDSAGDGICCDLGFGSYVIELDGRVITAGGTFQASESVEIGNCTSVLHDTIFVPAGNTISCSNKFNNSCRAPALCAVDSISIEPAGESVLESGLIDGQWTVKGAYALSFGSDCSISCTGSCSISSSPLICQNDEVEMRFELQFHNASMSPIKWSVENNEGLTLLERIQDSSLSMAIKDDICIPVDSCSFFIMEANFDSNGSYILYIDNEIKLSGNLEFHKRLVEPICPRETIISNSAALNSNNTWGSANLCNTGAQYVSVGLNVYEGNTKDGIVEYIPTCGASENSISRVNWFVMNGTGNVFRATLCGSSFDTQVSVFSGDCNMLNCVTGNDDDNYLCDQGNKNSMVTWDTVSGTEYYIAVYGYAYDWGSFRLEVLEVTVGDLCINAVALNINSSVDASTFRATEDKNINSCGSTYGYDGTPGIWFRIVGTGNWMGANTCGTTTYFDTEILIFSGTCTELECIAGDDDACYPQSAVSWYSVLGETYYMFVYGVQNYYGVFLADFNLNVADVQVPDNDDCDKSLVLDIMNTIESSTFWATEDENITSCGRTDSIQSPGIWFSITGTGNRMSAGACSTEIDFYLLMLIFSGTCHELECITDDNDSGYACGTSYMPNRVVSWDSVLGDTYYVLVYSSLRGRTGDFTLTVTDL